MTKKHAGATWLTRKETAERAGVDLRTVDNWLAQGILTRHRVGVRGVRIEAAEVEQLITPRPESGTRKSA